MKVNRRKFVCSAYKAASAASLYSVLPLLSCSSALSQTAPAKPAANAARPQVALTMDDPTLKLNSNALRWSDANTRILKAVASRNVRAALFVCGMRVDESDGVKLLSAWDQAGHLIGNHSYSYLFYAEQTSYSDFAVDFLKNEKIVAPYHNRVPLFRYPFLKEGDTAEKRDKFRALLKERGYRVGHVTIDASDWYVNQRLLRRWETAPATKVDVYRDFLIAHLLDRAAFYRQLAMDVLDRDIRHTLLVHFNTLNAFVLPDVMSAFESAGWQWIDASLAYEDAVFQRQPMIVPAGESLVWALAKESGRFSERLRYPGEDGVYEEPKMNALAL
jgi:peptidoglycan-N-acetylglucosamine deacetylase